MASRHRTKIRYVQKRLEEETGVKVSYQWLSMQVAKVLQDAFARSHAEDKDVKDVLVEIIRPLNRHQAETTSK